MRHSSNEEPLSMLIGRAMSSGRLNFPPPVNCWYRVDVLMAEFSPTLLAASGWSVLISGSLYFWNLCERTRKLLFLLHTTTTNANCTYNVNHWEDEWLLAVIYWVTVYLLDAHFSVWHFCMFLYCYWISEPLSKYVRWANEELKSNNGFLVNSLGWLGKSFFEGICYKGNGHFTCVYWHSDLWRQPIFNYRMKSNTLHVNFFNRCHPDWTNDAVIQCQVWEEGKALVCRLITF